MQQAPTATPGMKSTCSIGRWLGVLTSCVSNRFVVFAGPSPPLTSQPKFVPGLFSYNWTAATRPGDDQKNRPSRSLTVVVALAVARKSPPTLAHRLVG